MHSGTYTSLDRRAQIFDVRPRKPQFKADRNAIIRRSVPPPTPALRGGQFLRSAYHYRFTFRRPTNEFAPRRGPNFPSVALRGNYFVISRAGVSTRRLLYISCRQCGPRSHWRLLSSALRGRREALLAFYAVGLV